MATPFLTSEEYDERAHHLYEQGDYDAALRVLKEGIRLYPHAVELYIGLGFTRVARDEFVWAKQAFDTALVLDPENEEAMVGLGEVLLRIGRRDEALELFGRVRDADHADDLELLLTMGRALYRERLYDEACAVLADAVARCPDCADAAAALAYALHRAGRERDALRQLRRALRIDPGYYEARIYLGHVLYDRGAWRAALKQFESVPLPEHWDPLAIWRLVELKRAIHGLALDHPEVARWERRLERLDDGADPIEQLLAEVEHGVAGLAETRAAGGSGGSPSPVPPSPSPHRVRMPDGAVVAGSWGDIVRQLRDMHGRRGETVAQFMRRQAEEMRARSGVALPWDEPEAFLRASAHAGLLRIEY